MPCEATVIGGCSHPPSPSLVPSGGPVSIEVVFASDVPEFIRDAVLSAARLVSWIRSRRKSGSTLSATAWGHCSEWFMLRGRASSISAIMFTGRG